MSGFEFAGLILSTIPLVLIGLQEVHGRTSKILFKHQHVIASFIRDLNMEHAQFRSTLEKILGGLVDDLELARLLEDHKHHLWKDEQLEKSMKQRIGPGGYQSYINTVNRVASALAELRDAVGLKYGKVSDPSSSDFRAQLIRLSGHRKRNGTRKCENVSRHA
jgi:hypothetical protein